MEQEMSIIEILAVIRKRLIWMIIIPLIAGGIGWSVSYYVLTPMYEASTTLLVGRASDQAQLGYQDMLLNRQLISTYSEIARSRSVTESVIRALRLDLSVGELTNLINVSAVRDTEIIAIKVQNADPYLARRIANQMAQSFSKKIVGYSNIDNVMVVDKAILPRSPVSPNIVLNTSIAVVLGIMLALGLIFLLEAMDNTVKTPADIEQLLGLTVMAVVPVDGNGNGKGKGKGRGGRK